MLLPSASHPCLFLSWLFLFLFLGVNFFQEAGAPGPPCWIRVCLLFILLFIYLLNLNGLLEIQGLLINKWYVLINLFCICDHGVFCWLLAILINWFGVFMFTSRCVLLYVHIWLYRARSFIRLNVLNHVIFRQFDKQNVQWHPSCSLLIILFRGEILLFRRTDLQFACGVSIVYELGAQAQVRVVQAGVSIPARLGQGPFYQKTAPRQANWRTKTVADMANVHADGDNYRCPFVHKPAFRPRGLAN